MTTATDAAACERGVWLRELGGEGSMTKPAQEDSMTPRFEKTYCSQCGGEFGPGDSGFSHCKDHRHGVVMKGDTRCVEGRLLRHDPQSDDPDLETDIGACPECEGKGRNCDDCGASHADETWDIPVPPWAEHYCVSCADKRRDHYLEKVSG